MLLAQSRHETALGKEWMSVKISHLHLSDFMLFQQADFQWSPGINVICGTNSTGKTALIKLMYSLHSKEKIAILLAKELIKRYKAIG